MRLGRVRFSAISRVSPATGRVPSRLLLTRVRITVRTPTPPEDGRLRSHAAPPNIAADAPPASGAILTRESAF